MAHKVKLILNCDTDGCPRMADFKVLYGRQNDLYGRYCGKCVDEVVTELNKKESEDLQAK